MKTTYNIHESEEWRPDMRDFAPVFNVKCIRTTPAGTAETRTLATYTNRAAADLVISALRAAQNDLNT